MARRSRGQARGRSAANKPDTWTVEGVVEAVDSRKWGRETLYNIELDDGETYGFGRDLEDVQEGDVISFEAYENAKGYLTKQDGSVKLVEEGEEEPEPRSRGRSGRSGGKGKGRGNGRQNASQGRSGGKAQGSSKDDKRRSKEAIQYAEARRDAVATLNFLVEQEIIKLGAKNKPQERETAYWGMLDQLIAQFYEETDTLAALDRAADATSGGQDEPDDARDSDGSYDD